MIIEENTALGANLIVINKFTGGIYSTLKSFNTETCEAEVYVVINEREHGSLNDKIRDKYKPQYPIINTRVAILDKNNKKGSIFSGARNEIVVAKVTLHGSIAINKDTLKEIK